MLGDQARMAIEQKPNGPDERRVVAVLTDPHELADLVKRAKADDDSTHVELVRLERFADGADLRGFEPTAAGETSELGLDLLELVYRYAVISKDHQGTIAANERCDHVAFDRTSQPSRADLLDVAAVQEKNALSGVLAIRRANSVRLIREPPLDGAYAHVAEDRGLAT
jgi:hypothetical protein